MLTTQFDYAFMSAITEIRLIDARLSVLNIFMDQAISRIKNDPQIGSELFTAGFAFRDITLEVGSNNLFMPTDSYSLNRMNLSEEVDIILSREALFQISQAYEILETYLYNQVSDFIRLNNNLSLPNDLLLEEYDFNEIRNKLKRIKNRIRNKHLLKILRTNSNTFKTHELKNIYNIKFNNWIDMLGIVREIIIHSRGVISSSLNVDLTLFSNYFSIKNHDNQQYVFLFVKDAKEILHVLGGYMFMVYKAVTDDTFGSKTDFSTIGHIFHDPYYNVANKSL